MKLVLDTNVLLAAFISHGMCQEVLEHCSLRHEVVISEFILAEFQEKLTGKFRFTVTEADESAALLRTRFTMVVPHPLDQPICRDKDDDAIIATAIAGGCSCIITGDKDLLALRQVGSVQVLSPSLFWAAESRLS